MLALTFIDLDTQLLPDDLTLPLLWLGLIANCFGVFTDLRSAVLGAAGGYMILWSVYWALPADREEGGHGLRRLQAPRRDRRVDRLAGAAGGDHRSPRAWAP